MSSVRVSRLVFQHIARIPRRATPFLLVPLILFVILGTSAFRHSDTTVMPETGQGSPLVLPPGWPTPPVPADNPITQAKFVLGRQLFYETELSGDGKTSCSSCHDPYLSFAAHGPHAGAGGDTVKPLRNVPRLVNLAYDTVLMWDGHFHTLEQQAQGAILNKAELQVDTTKVFPQLASNPAYVALFTNAFGDGTITLDRITKAIATFDRCLISGNSPYDQYLNGDTLAMSASAIRGMNLFFDTTKTNCSDCHNNLGHANPNAAGQTFSDNNYYRTGTFESTDPRFGYGFDTTQDTFKLLDAGRAAVTHDSADIGRFRTPTLRNAAMTPPYGAQGIIFSLSQVLSNYNHGGNLANDSTKSSRIPNQDPRIKPLHLDSGQLTDLDAFINSLTDVSFISNMAFQDPGPPAAVIANRTISGDLSVYPNPATDFINAESPELNGLTEASLISENGATVWSYAANAQGRLRLDFTGVSNGVYRLELRSNNTSQSVNIVLQR